MPERTVTVTLTEEEAKAAREWLGSTTIEAFRELTDVDASADKKLLTALDAPQHPKGCGGRGEVDWTFGNPSPKVPCPGCEHPDCPNRQPGFLSDEDRWRLKEIEVALEAIAQPAGPKGCGGHDAALAADALVALRSLANRAGEGR